MLNQLFNIGSSVQWQQKTAATQCTKNILSWLLDTTSLTSKLERQCTTFSVEVRQEVTTSTKESLLSPYFPYPEKVLVREVILYCDNIPCVLAQTEIPYSTLSQTQEQLANIGSESLGKILFQDKTLKRAEIEIAEFHSGSALHDLSESLQQFCKYSLWARRSIFYVQGKPLLVSEVFLPASGIYKS